MRLAFSVIFVFLTALPVFSQGAGFDPVSRDGCFRRGDANNNGSVEFADAIRILLFLFEESVTIADVHECGAFNTNGDDAVNLSDAKFILEFLFNMGDFPPPPNVANPLGCDIDEPYDDCGIPPPDYISIPLILTHTPQRITRVSTGCGETQWNPVTAVVPEVFPVNGATQGDDVVSADGILFKKSFPCQRAANVADPCDDWEIIFNDFVNGGGGSKDAVLNGLQSISLMASFDTDLSPSAFFIVNADQCNGLGTNSVNIVEVFFPYAIIVVKDSLGNTSELKFRRDRHVHFLRYQQSRGLVVNAGSNVPDSNIEVWDKDSQEPMTGDLEEVTGALEIVEIRIGMRPLVSYFGRDLWAQSESIEIWPALLDVRWEDK